jgi:hypothetical protein
MIKSISDAFSRWQVDTTPIILTTSKATMQPPDNIELLDAVYFAAIQQRAVKVLEKAARSVRYARSEFESLKTEHTLPPEYRMAYEKMADSLLRTEQIVEKAADKNSKRKVVPRKAPIYHHDSPLSPELVSAIRRTIEEINNAELRLVNHCEAAIAAMRKRDVTGMIDWTMPVEYHFAVLLDPSPLRACYETCDHDEPLRIAVGFHSPGMQKKDEAPHNWNMFEYQEDHPLQPDHHGYLVHCIYDHSPIHWELMSHIREIEVTLEFSTVETAWKRSPSET